MINYWKQFEHSGSVEDYLSYRFLSDERSDLQSENAIAADGQARKVEPGGSLHAGIPVGDRPRIETDPYRGVR